MGGGLFWCYRGDQAGPPYRIEVTRAGCPRDACAYFRVAWPSSCVHELTAPGLVADCADLDPGDVGVLTVAELPRSEDDVEAWRRHGAYR